MNEDWSTKQKDIRIAQLIMEKHAVAQNSTHLGLFELVLNQAEKQMNFRISNWVVALAAHYNALYGSTQGEYVTRRVISHCMIQDETLH